VINLPQNLAAVNWQFGTCFESISLKLILESGFDTTKGLYFQCYDGFINEVGMYWGLQTNIYRPGRGFVGNGVIFSRWGTDDPSDAMIPENGFLENSAHEGQFIGVRKPVKLTPGEYTIKLGKTAGDFRGDWYSLSLQYEENSPTDCGSLLFPVSDNKGFTDGCGTWIEAYWTEEENFVLNESEIPQLNIVLETIFAGENIHPQSASVLYPYSAAVNISDVTRIGSATKWEIGPNVERTTPAGKLF
jgi:hypothetical protein